MANKKQEKLSARQERFAQNVALGMNKAKAAREAGYAPKNAARAGCLLTKNKDSKVQKRINELQKKLANSLFVCLGGMLMINRFKEPSAMRSKAFATIV